MSKAHRRPHDPDGPTKEQMQDYRLYRICLDVDAACANFFRERNMPPSEGYGIFAPKPDPFQPDQER